MSGHNKWSTIKHKKGAADAKRGKVFSKIAKEIMVAARNGGDPAANPTLRALIQKGRSVNMPRDNIDRAIKKGTGELGAVVFEEIMYEGYAGAGVGLIVICLTDNKNRAAAEIRHIFSKHGSSFAQQGSVSRGFQRKGQIFVDAAAVDEDKLMDIVLEAGADDMNQDGDQFEVITDPATFSDVVDALEAAGIETSGASVSMVADVLNAVDDKGKIKSILKFVAALEDNDDVQDVFTNLDAPDAIMQEIAEEE
ncbi:MAG: YebC/PmpR family DNA-binding transcriptional regulator [Kiritimatiellae bacterium]|nr:YebC/PmpR family DNA-binding transcriptional regulator [Kiritimatiellia bacterium]